MKIGAIVVSSVLALGSTAALADNFYVLGSVGQSKVKDLHKSDIDSELTGAGATGLQSSIDRTDTAYKLQAGYQFNKNFALEGGYFNLGKAAYSASYTGGAANASVKADGSNLSAVGSLPISDAFSVFGKLGAAYSTVKADVTATGPGGTAAGSAKDSKWGAVYGLGLNYNLTKQVALRAEYEIYDKVGGDNTGKSKVDVLSVGVAYKF